MGRLSPVLRFLQWAHSKICHTRRVDGLMVIAFDAAAVDKVQAALHVIRDHDPVRYRRLVRDLERIWVLTLGGPAGQFSRETWTCKLDERFLNDEATTPELLGSVIVHEATHARLHRLQFGYDEAIRERIERICLRRELAFAARIPGGIAGQWAEASLNSLPDYSDPAVAARDLGHLRETLKQLGWPLWLTDFLVAIGRWLHRRRARKKLAAAAASKRA